MATFTEIAGLHNNNTLRDKIVVAVASTAYAINGENVETANHANRMIWAKRALSNPVAVAQEMQMAVLVANKAFTVAQILLADDASIEAAVAGVVNLFADGV